MGILVKMTDFSLQDCRKVLSISQFPGENGIFLPKLFPGGHFGPKMVFFDTFWSLETTTDQLFYDGPGWVIRFL